MALKRLVAAAALLAGIAIAALLFQAKRRAPESASPRVDREALAALDELAASFAAPQDLSVASLEEARARRERYATALAGAAPARGDAEGAALAATFPLRLAILDAIDGWIATAADELASGGEARTARSLTRESYRVEIEALQTGVRKVAARVNAIR